MSRTDKSTPWWVKIQRSPAKYSVEVHDHRSGECDLPELPIDKKYWERQGTRCSWGFSQELLFGRGSGCPCWMCHGREDIARHTRKLRQESRERGRQTGLVHDRGADMDEVDWGNVGRG
jgi:hypothetical protein